MALSGVADLLDRGQLRAALLAALSRSALLARRLQAALLAHRPEELLDRVRHLREHLRALLAVGVGMLATLLGARLGGLLEGLERGLQGARAPGDERERGLAQLRDVLTEADALCHARVAEPDALVGTPATDLDRVRDGVRGGPLLRRLDVLEGRAHLLADLTAPLSGLADLLAALDGLLTRLADLLAGPARPLSGPDRLRSGLAPLLGLSRLLARLSLLASALGRLAGLAAGLLCLALRRLHLL